jgi:hypothetical protein
MWYKKQIELVLLLSVVLVCGCERNKEVVGSSDGRLNVYLTDSPAVYDAVNIVIREVAVQGDDSGWFVLNDSVRTFNLLSLTNGAWKLLGATALKPGHYTQIRLIADSGSNVVVNGVTHSLIIPSGMETGIKIIHEFDIQADFTYDLMLDFDVSRSIQQLGNGEYHMQPVIRAQAALSSGTMIGFAAPVSARPWVTASDGTDTVTVFADTTSGMFKFIALPQASYWVHIVPTDTTHKDTTLTNVQVKVGQVTNVGTIALSSK